MPAKHNSMVDSWFVKPSFSPRWGLGKTYRKVFYVNSRERRKKAIMRRRRVDLASVHAGPTYFGFEGREIPFLVSSCL